MSLSLPVLSSQSVAATPGPRSATVLMHLRQAICQVVLKPGAALSENELAAQLGVSRTPVREALRHLVSEGLVTVTPQVGTRVSLLDLAGIRDALFVREAIETTALLRQTAVWDEPSLQRLVRIVDAQEQALVAQDSAQVLSLDEAFHRALIELCGHAGAWPYVLRAREVHSRLRTLAQTLPQAPGKSVQQHRAIIAALAANDVPQAVTLMREHLQMNVTFAEQLAAQLPQYFLPLH